MAESVPPHTGEAWEAALRFLSRRSTLTLATVDESGHPYVASLYFVHDERLRLYFLSSPESRHVRHLTARPEVAVTVHGEPWDWKNIQGLQLTGIAETVEDPAERERVMARYREKFPFIEELPQALAHARLYRITPRWVRWIDNTKGFGYRVEWRLG
ncbi:pyridoxamine 5'-phosphate oxidase family protein [Thermoflexus sp.]|uniref:pyridoxamine 5'-phosphate oxidase family protein n=1 Tax=Thermoflexus sp. TaxID=1969742 RepID=UPI00177334A0|nr:pyridoxamine 5'-phosphate oxidase family protein [Thermoflexus sp.]